MRGAGESTLGSGLLIALGTFLFSAAVVSLAPQPIQYDASGNWLLARNLAAGHGFSLLTTIPFWPTAFREPGYPWFLSLIFRVGGDKPIGALMVQCVLHGLMAWGVFAFLNRSHGVFTAWIGAMLVGFDPALTSYCGVLLTEILSAFLLLSVVFLFSQTLHQYRKGYYFSAAIICALLTLTRSAFLFFPFGLLLLILFTWGDEPRGRRVRLVLLFVLVYSVPLAAWSVRNKVRLGVLSLTSRPGISLWYRAARSQYTVPQMTKYLLACVVSERLARRMFPETYGSPDGKVYLEHSLIQGGTRYVALGRLTDSDLAADRMMAKEALAMIREHPFKYLFMHLGELIKLLYFDGVTPEHATYAFPSKLLWFLFHAGLRVGYSFFLWIVAVRGFYRWARPEALLVALPIVYTLSVYIWFHTVQRFTVPVIPFILMLAAYTLASPPP